MFKTDRNPVNQNTLFAINRLSVRGKKIKDDVKYNIRPFIKPKPRLFEGLINHPRYRPFFAKLRYMPGIYFFLSSNYIARLLFVLGVRQDMFE